MVSLTSHHQCDEHIYYRWKLYSLLQGDSKYQWRSEPFQMFAEGPWWIPPEVPFDNNVRKHNYHYRLFLQKNRHLTFPPTYLG